MKSESYSLISAIWLVIAAIFFLCGYHEKSAIMAMFSTFIALQGYPKPKTENKQPD